MKTNSLVYRTNKTVGQEDIYVNIRLNDECKNGHQDFAITADIYQTGKPKTDRYHISGGCCHDEIVKAFPQLKIFVDLHLSDYLGNPSYATANGWYFLKNGFNNCPSNSEKFQSLFCEHYRIDFATFDVLKTAYSQTHYAMLLLELGVPELWKKQADEAIKILEELTGDEFVVDSVKNQFGMPKPETIEEEIKRIEAGYYSEEQATQRQEQAKIAFIANLEKEAQKGIDKINAELSVKKALFEIGGKELIENVIYYTHSNSLGYNWRGYGEKLTEAEVQDVQKRMLDFGFALDYKIG